MKEVVLSKIVATTNADMTSNSTGSCPGSMQHSLRMSQQNASNGHGEVAFLKASGFAHQKVVRVV